MNNGYSYTELPYLQLPGERDTSAKLGVRTHEGKTYTAYITERTKFMCCKEYVCIFNTVKFDKDCVSVNTSLGWFQLSEADYSNLVTLLAGVIDLPDKECK